MKHLRTPRNGQKALVQKGGYTISEEAKVPLMSTPPQKDTAGEVSAPTVLPVEPPAESAAPVEPAEPVAPAKRATTKRGPAKRRPRKEAPAVNLEHNPVMGYNPISILLVLMDKYGKDRVKGIANVILLFSILLVVAAAVTLVARVQVAVFGILIAIFLLPLIQFLGEKDRSKVSQPQSVFIWTSLVLGILSMACLVTSVFFNQPVHLQGLVFSNLNPDIVVDLPPDLRDLRLDTKSASAPPDWLYPAGAAKNEIADLKRKMGSWVSWSSSGIKAGKLVEASWRTGFPGHHHFTAILKQGDVDRSQYRITDGLVLVIDDSRSKENIISMRQFPLKISESLEDPPSCEFKDVYRGEKLLLLLQVIPVSNDAKLPDTFNLTLHAS